LKDISAALLLEELTAIGIKVRLSDHGKLCLKPKACITPDLIERVRADQEQLAQLVRERTQTDHIARLDVERREADRQTGRGYDFDCAAPSHAGYLQRTGQRCACQISPEEQRKRELDRLACADGWVPPTPAHAIVAACQRAGVALRIDPATGDLVVGKAGAKADEPTQPWLSLLLAIEAHLEAVANWSRAAEHSFRVSQVRCRVSCDNLTGTKTCQ
jgi:hypothetical protein